LQPIFSDGVLDGMMQLKTPSPPTVRTSQRNKFRAPIAWIRLSAQQKIAAIAQNVQPWRWCELSGIQFKARNSAYRYGRIVRCSGPTLSGADTRWRTCRATDRNRVWAGGQCIGPASSSKDFPGQGALGSQSHHRTCGKCGHGASLRVQVAQPGGEAGGGILAGAIDAGAPAFARNP